LALHKYGRHLPSSVLNQNNNVQSIELILSSHPLMDILENYPVMDMGDCCKDFYYSKLSTDAAGIMNRSLKDKTFWDSCRQFRITGSRCYSLYTYNKTLKTDEQWSFKSSKYFWAKSFTNKFVKHGIEYENTARDLYASCSNQKIVECGLVINSKNPWLGYTPDGVIVNNENVPIKLIEIKCPFKGNSLSIKDLIPRLNFIIQNSDDSLSLKKNHSYYAQAQMGMVLLNVQMCDFIIYSSYDNNYTVINVIYDELYCKDLFFSLKKIYFERLLHEACTYTC